MLRRIMTRLTLVGILLLGIFGAWGVVRLSAARRGEGMLLGGTVNVPDFKGATGWLNSPPLAMKDLRGRVVLVDFWEYTCVNCLRTLPYVKSWHDKYKDKGLVIVGVHTPEFEFGKSEANVREAAQQLGISYPIALDSDYAIWSAYANSYWPRKYLIDAQGKIRYDHAGEGGYEEFEGHIQELLKEADPRVSLPPVDKVGDGIPVGAVCYQTTSETYCGYERGTLANPEGYKPGQTVAYRDPGNHQDGKLYAQGRWYNDGESLRHLEALASPDAYLGLRYHAVEVNLVMKPEKSVPAKVHVSLDGQPVPGEYRGKDIRKDSSGMTFVEVIEPRMYNLINGKMGTHELRLSTASDGVGLYAFTFGGCEEKK